jgi:hypothetical protein
MKATARVLYQSTRPVEDNGFTTVPIGGATEEEIAQRVAQIAARHHYGETGTTGFMCRRTGGGFNACIGEYVNGVLEGVTVVIHLEEVEKDPFSL